MLDGEFTITAKTLSGLEEVLAGELAELGAAEIEAGNRIVSCRGDRELLYRAAAKAELSEPDLGKYSAMAKLFCSDTAMEVTVEAVQVLVAELVEALLGDGRDLEAQVAQPLLLGGGLGRVVKGRGEEPPALGRLGEAPGVGRHRAGPAPADLGVVGAARDVAEQVTTDMHRRRDRHVR